MRALMGVLTNFDFVPFLSNLDEINNALTSNTGYKLFTYIVLCVYKPGTYMHNALPFIPDTQIIKQYL